MLAKLANSGIRVKCRWVTLRILHRHNISTLNGCYNSYITLISLYWWAMLQTMWVFVMRRSNVTINWVVNPHLMPGRLRMAAVRPRSPCSYRWCRSFQWTGAEHPSLHQLRSYKMEGRRKSVFMGHIPFKYSLMYRQGHTQAGVAESGSHFDSQTPDYWQNDTQMYFVRYSVFVEYKEIFQQLNL